MKRLFFVISIMLVLVGQTMAMPAFAEKFKGAREWTFGSDKSVTSLFAPRAKANAKVGPVENYGFISAPDGSMWTYTASFQVENSTYTQVTLNVYDNQKNLVGTIIDSLNLNDSLVTGVNQAEINPLVTQKFFNNDAQYEIMLFLHAQTKDYEGRYLNHIFSIASGDTVTQPVMVVEGRQVYAQNIGDYNENYVMVFARDSARNSSNYTLCYDIRRKAVYGDGVHHTFRVPYANIAALTDLQPIFMFKNGKQLNYVLQQYEKPYFDASVPMDQDPVVNPDNNLVITYLNQTFDTLYTTKVPIVQDENAKLLYTFPSIGTLNGMDDILLNQNGGTAPAYVVTMEKYNLESDGSLCSFYVYDAQGNVLGTIAENTAGRLMMSPITGCEKQWLFLKDEDEGKFLFVDVPSCKKVLEMSIYLEDGSVLSQNIDRVPVGDAYQYVVALLQGDSEKDGSVTQRIAWIGTSGKLHHYDKVNLGKYIEAANVNIDASVLNPWLFNTDDAREYMVLVKRYNPDNTSDKETALLICNTEGEILLDYGKNAEMGGNINMVYVLNGGNSKLVCVYVNGNNLTLNYTDLPLNTPTLNGKGTPENPYQLATAGDFMLIDKNPNAYYEVVDDIDFLGTPFEGMRQPFYGVLNGKNHVLSNLLLIGGGLFSEVKDSVTIKDLRFSKPVLVLSENNKNAAGILANAMQGGISDAGVNISATLSNIHMLNPHIKAYGYTEQVGSLLGEASLFLDINECSVTDAEIYAPQAHVGGLVAKVATASSIHASAFGGVIEAGGLVGGIAAEISSDNPIYDCHVNADIQANNAIGGIVGFSARSTIFNCFAEGTLTLNPSSKNGKVGGIVGEIETDAVGMDSTIVLQNCLVGLNSISAPEGADVIVHRVAGFTSCNNYEYDWDHVDWSKPQEEWPRLYYGEEKFIKNNYVISELAAMDSTVALADTTTEGANITWAELTTEWLSEHGYQLGDSVAAPWELGEEMLQIWYEGEIDIPDALENVVIGENITIENGLLNTNGKLSVYTLSGTLVLQGNGQIDTTLLNQGVYIVTITNQSERSALKLLVP